MRRMMGISTAVTAALLIVGVAWAADRPAETPAGFDVSAAADAAGSLAGSSSSEATEVSSASSTSVSGSSSTSLGSSTSTTAPGASSSTSSPGSSTSTTFEEEFTAADGGTFQVASGVSVTVDVKAGVLLLLDVSAPGWRIEIKDIRPDRIRIEFARDGDEARFEAEIDDGRLEIEIRRS